MDLIRKMSGLRSSQELSAELARGSNDAVGEEGREEEVLEEEEEENGDVYEDAAAPGQQHQDQERDDSRNNGKKDASAPSIRVRAPVSEETEEPEELDDDDDDENEAGGEEDGEVGYSTGESFDSALAPSIRVRAPVSEETEELGNEETEAGGEEEDGEDSYGSGESFNSALERMVASSTASYDTASSPTSSPVGPLAGPAVLGSLPSVMSVSQQSALMQLNQMVTGDDSLDTSIIDNSTEDMFQHRIAELAESRGESFDDASFGSIVDALLPLVLEKSQKQHNDLNSEGVHSTFEASVGADAEARGAESLFPDTIAHTEGESYLGDKDDTNKVIHKRNGSAENADHENDIETMSGDDIDMSEGILQKEIRQEASVSSDSEQEPRPFVSSVPQSNGGKDEGLEESGITEQADGDAHGESVTVDGSDNAGDAPEEVEKSAKVPAMPKAKLTVEDEFGGGDERKKIGDSIETEQAPELTPEETQTMPIAKLTDDDARFTGGRHDKDDNEEDETGQEKLSESKSGYLDALHEGTVDTRAPEELSDKSVTQTGHQASQAQETFKIPTQAEVDEERETVPGSADEREDPDETGEWDDEIEEDEGEDGGADTERLSALAALVRAADSPVGGVDNTTSLGAAGPSLPARPTRTGRSSVPSLEPTPRAVQQPHRTAAVPPQMARSMDDGHNSGEVADGHEDTREKLQVIRVKFLRLALRLGQPAHNVVVAQVLYRLGLAEQLRGGRSTSRGGGFSFDRASAVAEELEAIGPEELDFTCTIMVLGKTGVGKSATINSIFDEPKTGTNAFSPSTKKVQVITGHVHGIKVRIIDTPGLLPSVADQRHNEKVIASVKGFISKQSPDIVLYFDRLDMQSRDYGDVPLLRTITDTFGAAVWFNAIVVLTHASSAPPDGPNGLPLSYEMFVAQQSHVVQQTIRQAAGDMRLMNPVSLVENHSACRVNRSRQRVLPNGQVWKPQLLLLCFASKILAEANSVLKLQDSSPAKPFGARTRAPPLPYLLSSLLQSRAQLKLPDEQLGEDDESDEELEEDEDSDEEEDYDQLPPFRRLAKEEVAELDDVNRSNYFEELAERERLFQKKLWKEERKRRRELKKRMAEAPLDQSQFVDEGLEDDMARSASVPVPMPDMVLPPSFDSDNPSHRYRYLETANQWLVRPVLETHGWDHDNGYDGMSVEKMFVIGDTIPASVSGQITKDKKDANLNMECAASLKHGEGKITLAGLDLQTVGKDVAYTLRSETRFSNFKGNKTTGGLALTLLGDTVSAGMKIEDRLIIGKRVKVVLNGGVITGRSDVAYGGSLEATLRDQDYPLSRTLSSLGLSIMDWHGDLAIGGNLQSQFVLGKSMMVGRASLNNRGAGQITIRASSSEQLQMALIGLLPIIRSLANRLLGSQSQQ